jgi:hypothetical protein
MFAYIKTPVSMSRELIKILNFCNWSCQREIGWPGWSVEDGEAIVLKKEDSSAGAAAAGCCPKQCG